jgi:hypothetical protein
MSGKVNVRDDKDSENRNKGQVMSLLEEVGLDNLDWWMSFAVAVQHYGVGESTIYF